MKLKRCAPLARPAASQRLLKPAPPVPHDELGYIHARTISGIDWLNTDRRTLFLLTAHGRIERENDPDHSPGPNFWLARCREGSVIGIRADLPDDVAAELDSISAAELRFTLPVTPPRHLDQYVALVARASGVARQTFGLIYELPHSLRYESHEEPCPVDRQQQRKRPTRCAVLVRARHAPWAYQSLAFAVLRISGRHGAPLSSMGRSPRSPLPRVSRMWGPSLVS
jgi:hypothetical protein